MTRLDLTTSYPLALAACCYCDQLLTFSLGLRAGEGPAWRHPDGEVYQGRCLCEGQPHKALRAWDSAIQCPTWRDSHCATPDRSRVPAGAL